MRQAIITLSVALWVTVAWAQDPWRISVVTDTVAEDGFALPTEEAKELSDTAEDLRSRFEKDQAFELVGSDEELRLTVLWRGEFVTDEVTGSTTVWSRTTATSKYPPAKPGALVCEPLKAA